MPFETNSLQLTYAHDHEWLITLKKNDHKKAKALLQSATEAEKQRLVNGRFHRTEIHDGLSDFQVTHPWNIAAIHASEDILELLFQ